MKKDQIIQMAHEAGAIPIHKDYTQKALVGNENIERFAALVAADYERRLKFTAERWAIECQSQVEIEREACAKVCEDGVDTEHPTVKGHIMENFGASSHLAKAIRARGQA